LKSLPAIVIALIVAAGLAILGYFVGDGIRNVRSTDRSVNVRGLAERLVTADSATLVINVERSGAAPAAIFPELSKTQAEVMAFLQQQGLKEDDIDAGQWSTSRTSAQELKDDPSLPRYTVSGAIYVSTHNIEATQKAYRNINELRVKTAGGVGESRVAFSFKGIGKLRTEMIAAATLDARNAAAQFAKDSGSRVGSIRNASQGVFQILAPGEDHDDPEVIRKNVRVVTTVDYELRD
jgi:uncharacterized protein